MSVMKRSIFLVLVICYLGSTALGQTPVASSSEPGSATDVVRRFWRAVGDLDGDGVIACLDWPSAIIETSDRGTKPLKTVVDADAVKAEIARSRDPERAPQRGDFFGTEVMQCEVRMVNASLAYVPHRCRVDGDVRKTGNVDRREFDAVAIVRKDQVTQTWRIMVITIDQ